MSLQDSSDLDPRRRLRSSRRLRAAADYVDGVPVKTIRQRHGMGNRELHRVIKRLHVPWRNESRRKELADKVAKYYRAGIQVDLIAVMLKVSPRTVRRFVTKLDLPRRHAAAWGRECRTEAAQ